ncbi:MAG: class I SAM-dependent methyltransferase [Gemmatimonadales bacterium]|nr:class I SAM-dependent methyltransferase [Gemmatimonadales bacterium]
MGTWEYYGKHNPYYGVLSHGEFRFGVLDESARRKFFESGVEVVDGFIALAEKAFGPLRYGVALDYGCGVGRLTRRLAERFREVIGVDISSEMLEEARRNLADQDNVSFQLAGSEYAGSLDLVISKIVFLHIAPEEGYRILERLASRLAPGGVGILDLPVRYTGGRIRRALSAARSLLPRREPVMPLHIYDLRKLKAVLARSGCEMRNELADTPVFEKAVVVFRRQSG